MKNVNVISMLFLATAAAFLVANGCSGSNFRNVSVAQGEYYSEDEYDLLPGGRKTSYCNALESELAASQAEFESKTNEIADTKNLTASTRQRIVPIEAEVRRLESDVRSLNDQVAAVKALPAEWKVRPGETLTSIAMLTEIYNDIDKWERILQANLDKIEDPYYIFPDTVLRIPRDFPVE